MYQYKDMDDTIVAVATPAGVGGIGIVRLSGKRAFAIADQLFAAKNGGLPSDFKSFSAHYGWVKRSTGDGLIDEVVLTVYRAPKSYTAEDVVEISCHGGQVPVKAVLSSAIDLGARMAEPGEFTKRAFLNGCSFF